MDFRLIFSTFILIFLAELGDKTQFAAMAASAGCNKPVSVLIGASLALVLSSVIAVAVGSLIGTHIPLKFIKIAAGVLFIIFGALYLKEAFISETAEVEKSSIESTGILGESILKAARVYEKQELRMLQSARKVIFEKDCIATIDDIIREEEEHLRSLFEIQLPDERLSMEEDKQFAPLVEEYACSEEDSQLINDLYQRQMAMADFYKLMSGKSKIASVKQTFYELYEDELLHSERLRTLL